MKRLERKHLFSLLSATFILLLWKLTSLIIDAEIILPSPEAVTAALFNIISTKDFLIRVGTTLTRGIIGFLISYCCGIVVGVTAGIYPIFRGFIKPILSIIKSTPVISVILLALIWFNTNYVPIFVSFLMAFPIVCTNVIEGVTTVDKKLLDMANIYNIPFSKQIFSIYLPSILPFILAGASMSLGIIWKVVVAAEVLSQPKWGIGTSLNEAKSFLITREVFAWTLIAILLSFISDTLFGLLSYRLKWRTNDNK